MFSSCGRRLLPAIQLGAPVSALHCSAHYVMVLTAAATLSVWSVLRWGWISPRTEKSFLSWGVKSGQLGGFQGTMLLMVFVIMCFVFVQGRSEAEGSGEERVSADGVAW